MKNNKKEHRGCWKWGIIGVIALLLAVIAGFYLYYFYNKSTTESRFNQLLNAPFDNTELVTDINAADFRSFKNKVTTSCQTIDSSPLFNDNELNLNNFYSNKLLINDSLSLNGKDFAIILRQAIKSNLETNNELKSLQNALSVERCILNNTETVISYKIIIKLSFKAINLNGIFKTGMPEEIFLTLNASFDSTIISKDLKDNITSYSIIINALTGEDNDYVTKELLKMLNLEKSALDICVLPYGLLKDLLNMWQASLTIDAQELAFNQS